MIGFVGLSHLGLISSIATAAKGFDVIAYDPRAELCEQLNQQQLPVLEPDLPELLAEQQSRIRFTAEVSKLSHCALVYFAIDIPTDANNQSDLGALQALLDSVTPHLTPGTILVILSQVPPGFTRKFAVTCPQLTVIYQVETLIFGRAVERALYPERFIVGCADPTVGLPELYTNLLSAFDCPILPMRYESAELAKISINMCLVASVSTANTLAEICEAIGADWSEIIPALKLDKRIGQYSYLAPGLGISGGNLERDLVTITQLAKEFGTDGGVVEAWLANSRYRRDWVLRMLHSEVFAAGGTGAIALWGLAYKANTHSTKNSPALALLQHLTHVPVQAYDPQVVLDHRDNVTQTDSALAACQGAIALVVMTPWAEFTTADLAQVKASLAQPLIIDPYAALDESKCRDLGFTYYRLGVR